MAATKVNYAGEPVALVVADSLDDVFRITNLWEEDESVKRFRTGHSTSVGDLIEDTSTGKIHMVDSFGFQEVA